MKIYIDTNTFPASPAIYADAEKTKALPRILPAVELQRGGFEVAFLGGNQPQDIATVSLAASIEGTQTQVIAELGRESETEEAWQFDFALSAEALVAEVAKHGSARLRVGVIVEDDTERREWQLVAMVYPSASGETDPKQVESAKDFADVAEREATRAEEAAQNAEQSSQNASESAEAASKSQEAAAQSAKEAAQSKADAISSKNAAETAKTDAEKAKTDAGAAKAGAERARDDANEILRNIESEAESVETAGEQALVEIETSKQEAKAEIEAFTDVYTKSEIDGITGAEVTLKMNEICAQLKDYEEVTGEKLPFDFWEAVMAEFQRWQKNPNEVKEWVTKKNADGTFSSTNPYYETPPTKPVVDFNVKTATGISDAKGSFGATTNEIIYLPNATECRQIFFGVNGTFALIAPNATSIRQGCARTSGAKVVFLPKAKNLDSLLLSSQSNPVVYAPNAEGLSYFARYAVNYNRPPSFPAATNWNDFAFGARKYNAFADMPSASTAKGAFTNTAMSAENISATLDSLPAWTDGASHVITFTGSPGAAELTQDSPSVAAAVARGWTVEL